MAPQAGADSGGLSAETPDTSPHGHRGQRTVGVPATGSPGVVPNGSWPGVLCGLHENGHECQGLHASEVNRWIEEDLGSMAVQEVLKDFFQMVGGHRSLVLERVRPLRNYSRELIGSVFVAARDSRRRRTT